MELDPLTAVGLVIGWIVAVLIALSVRYRLFKDDDQGDNRG